MVGHIENIMFYYVCYVKIVYPPAPKKGMVKFSRKGHFQRAATCKEGIFKHAATCKEGTFKPASLTFLQSYLLLPFFPKFTNPLELRVF